MEMGACPVGLTHATAAIWRRCPFLWRVLLPGSGEAAGHHRQRGDRQLKAVFYRIAIVQASTDGQRHLAPQGH